MPIRRPPSRAPSSWTPTAARSPARGGFPGPARPSPRRSSFIAGWSPRAAAPKAPAARGRLGPVVHDARAARGGGERRLPGSRLLRLLGGGGLPEAAARRRLAHPPRTAPPGRSTTSSSPPTARPERRRDRPVPPRPRDLHAQAPLAAAVGSLPRLLWAWSYVPRAVAATFLPGHDARRYWLHARQALRPTHAARACARRPRRTTSSSGPHMRTGRRPVRSRAGPRRGPPPRRPRARAGAVLAGLRGRRSRSPRAGSGRARRSPTGGAARRQPERSSSCRNPIANRAAGRRARARVRLSEPAQPGGRQQRLPRAHQRRRRAAPPARGVRHS